ncbi:glycine oxidase ThiO [Hansschlegelia plantiphila]|uniref:Glycine oxidase ThiO n=1 Tax=Hansschlegelia plantiphila TaxID=374655 RepID=A0A9W6IZH8_9HYPH|nr:glycine oxidase ThiO [Hansschlegelia plantiphila]GLK66933.1 glycine oxidase ThiO [Hansschlegelia plantiphila]
MRVTIVGAGVAGLVAAVELAERGVAVEILERGLAIGERACSWAAGGMLAPWCERESAEQDVAVRGEAALVWWPKHIGGVEQNGTLVVAPRRDAAELARFAQRTERFERIDGAEIGALEPDLEGRFDAGLFFREEGHLDPRRALQALAARLGELGVPIRFGVTANPEEIDSDAVLDCRGFVARRDLDDLRGVRGEMLLLRTSEVSLSRPVRLLHPRIPLYVVPRADGLFMVGATMIESAARGGVTARSAVDLLNGAYALHPAFGEAEIVETRADVRPAFPDNLPRVVRDGRVLRLNGLYRHGFLLSPALAGEAAAAVFDMLETPDEADRQRLTA